MDARSASGRILSNHAEDQLAQLFADSLPAESRPMAVANLYIKRGFPMPVLSC